jgi:Hg(II)-responsive transcriptional regulator
MAPMQTGELARRASVNVETLRYYERRGLIDQPARQANGYRSYSADVVKRVLFIKRAQRLGFSLDEVNVLLHCNDDPYENRLNVRAVASDKIVEIDTKIDELHRMRDALAQLVEECHRGCSPPSCPILEAIAESSDSGRAPAAGVGVSA